MSSRGKMRARAPACHGSGPRSKSRQRDHGRSKESENDYRGRTVARVLSGSVLLFPLPAVREGEASRAPPLPPPHSRIPARQWLEGHQRRKGRCCFLGCNWASTKFTSLAVRRSRFFPSLPETMPDSAAVEAALAGVGIASALDDDLREYVVGTLSDEVRPAPEPAVTHDRWQRKQRFVVGYASALAGMRRK